MNAERLIAMANDIANFFAAEPDREAAIEGVSNHFKRFWEPRMRKQIVAHVQAHGAAGLSDLASNAVARLAELDGAG
jgi:formate dehydrogenase subunit delta